MSAVFKALAEPRRRAILRLLSDSELAAGDVAAEFSVTRPAISQHLAVLREAGLVTDRRDGTRRLYRAIPDGVGAARRLLDELWATGLDVGRRLAEGEDGLGHGSAAEAS